ncbi:hypothetical protein [Caballeronia sp. S22]|uniref:hypothetical protein n=1 Tax=Caballeronia sp. S22 TaxID=3137182 RepID=UPI00353129CE
MISTIVGSDAALQYRPGAGCHAIDDAAFFLLKHMRDSLFDVFTNRTADAAAGATTAILAALSKVDRQSA